MVIELDNTNSEAYCFRGVSKLKLNQKEGACEDFNIASEMGNIEANNRIKENCK
jgi:hypothetical protein